jgi:hypothetical protein
MDNMTSHVKVINNTDGMIEVETYEYDNRYTLKIENISLRGWVGTPKINNYNADRIKAMIAVIEYIISLK